MTVVEVRWKIRWRVTWLGMDGWMDSVGGERQSSQGRSKQHPAHY